MDEQLITIERVGIDNKVVQITFGKGAELPLHLPEIENVFRTCFQKKDYEIILNMTHVKYPPTTFIALLVEATNEARRMCGDIKLINVPLTTKNNFITFCAKTFLSIPGSEENALRDFGEEIVVTPASIEEIKTTVTKENDPQIAQQTISNPEKSFDFSLHEQMQGEKLKVKSKTDNLYEICDFVTNHAHSIGFDRKEIGKLKVTIYEACLNVIEHAYFSNPDNWIEVSVFHDYEKMIILIHDWGQGFEFNPTTNYNVEQAMNDRRTGGFGMHIIQRSVDDIKYEANEKSGNKLFLIKYLQSDHVMIK